MKYAARSSKAPAAKHNSHEALIFAMRFWGAAARWHNGMQWCCDALHWQRQVYHPDMSGHVIDVWHFICSALLAVRLIGVAFRCLALLGVGWSCL